MCMKCIPIIAVCASVGFAVRAAEPWTAPVRGQSGVQEQRGTPPGTIRVRVRLVPVDVIVTDQRDRPVTDLRREDFQIFENGRLQEIRHFSVERLTAAAPPPGPAPATTMRPIPVAELSPQQSRTFLILMGRGRHQTPFRSVDSLIRFVRERLLPQDRVAVFAYNRATDFTTDHEQIARVLERYKIGHERIESWMESRMSGLAAVYGSKDIPKSFQSEIDRIFISPGGVASRRIPPGRMNDQGVLQRDMRKALAEELRDPEAAAISLFDALEAGMITEMPFDEFAAASAATSQDMQNLFTCIQYMRYMEGEKHLLFFTGQGLFFPMGRTEGYAGVTEVANDARVALDTFQTGGLSTPPAIPRIQLGPAGIVRPQPNPGGWVPDRTYALQSMREVSRLTGGRTSVFEDIGKALDRINEITLAQYLLGYYPQDERWDGGYRKIDVKVNRPGLKVYFRHGYYARDTLRPYDKEEFLAYSRVSAAAFHEGNLDDLPFQVSTKNEVGAGGQQQIRVQLRIDPSRVEFRQVNDRHAARLRIVFFWANSKGEFLGEDWRNVDFRLMEDTYQNYLASGIPFSMSIPLLGPKQIIKVIVYDTSGDHVGSRLIKTR